jgi:HPt (histidine-containing phosphotransfer) domain-containing protein
LRFAAADAAHKLAGILGTFGLVRGTEIARHLEQTYSADFDPASDQDLAELTAELRSLIESR